MESKTPQKSQDAWRRREFNPTLLITNNHNAKEIEVKSEYDFKFNLWRVNIKLKRKRK